MYFPLAAARYAPVHVNGIVGSDTAAAFRRILAHPGIDLEGMVVSESPTFRWHAVHDFDRWVTSEESSEPGCDPEWEPVLPERSRRAEVFFVGSMDPSLQRAVLDQSERGADRRRFHDRLHRAAGRDEVRSPASSGSTSSSSPRPSSRR